MSIQFATAIQEIRALKDHVIVTDMNFSGRQLSSGVILLGDDGKTAGIRPRWAQVYTVGPEQTDVTVGQWILVAHGRWSRGAKVEIGGQELTIRRVDPKDILMVSDTEPSADDNISTAVQAQAKTR
jgi:hypothetical protein